MHELVEPALAVVDRLTGIVFFLGVVGVEKAADARMACTISVNQLAVAPYTASPPYMELGLGIEFAGRQLDHRRKNVRFGVGIHAGPGRFAAEMRLGEVPLAPGIEQVLDSIEVEKERVAAAAGKESVGA